MLVVLIGVFMCCLGMVRDACCCGVVWVSGLMCVPVRLLWFVLVGLFPLMCVDVVCWCALGLRCLCWVVLLCCVVLCVMLLWCVVLVGCVVGVVWCRAVSCRVVLCCVV